MIAGFQLLRNMGRGQKTHLPDFQALVEFHDSGQFSAAFAAQAAQGIHTGLHGQVLSSVAEFRIEVFEQLRTSGAPAVPTPLPEATGKI